ncbi:uncharacterized protein LOC115431752 isoform X2 [Sphaeramia orbicularis]|uniref:uncharacterized protein LOC115431752 isoform X2 n=1 Tax=Sphaeramia orbicularis TaxID=375764 RepID=UPI00117D2D6E|nr:uncharacterized protein LOC115431752 isoform X2 [Sphaeramia orbicularis]
MQSQRVKKTGNDITETKAPIIPQVRYHPSIKTSGAGGQAQTRTGKNQKTRSAGARYPQRGEVVQKNQDKQNQGNCGAGDSRSSQVLLKPSADTAARPKCTDPDPQVVSRSPPTPDQVPLGLGVHVDRSVVDQVEVLTRGQRTNQDWFEWRKNRITASVAHRIAHCHFVHGKTKTPPTSYLADITGEGRRVQTRAMSWGVEQEAEAVRRYQGLKSAALRRPVSVQDCGLFIDAHRPWLAASPDGIVTDSRTGQWLLCLEVKCPYKHRHRRVEDACRDNPDFCLQIVDEDGQNAARCPGPRYRLKSSHSYFTQIQCQLAVTGLKNADLVVFTLKETAVVPVTFDPELWAETVSRLEVFYRDALLPHLQQKTAAWTPEL